MGFTAQFDWNANFKENQFMQNIFYLQKIKGKFKELQHLKGWVIEKHSDISLLRKLIEIVYLLHIKLEVG